jgi:hypothetical protein
MTYRTKWPDAPMRFVITHIDNRTGMRTLAEPMQGRYTYATIEEAQACRDAMMKANSPDRLASLFGLPLEVREVPCWPGHHDPMTCWFDIKVP